MDLTRLTRYSDPWQVSPSATIEIRQWCCRR
jgi:hypothetical protein